MAKREFIRREDLTELDCYKVDSGKYVGIKLGDAFDDLAISDHDIVKPYLDKLKEKIIDYYEIGCDLHCLNCKMVACIEPKDALMVLSFIDSLLSEQGDTE